MVIRRKSIGDRIKYWVKPDIENRIKEGNINAYFSSEIIEIGEEEVLIKTQEGNISIENDCVLALTGYKPNFSFLESMGVSLSKDGKYYPT
jgi:thioredoxin reductase